MRSGRLGKEASRILGYIWSLADESGGTLKLDEAPGIYMPLSVEIITPSQISLCHYGEMNGDLMRDPEMCFFKNMSGEFFPTYFRNDYLGVERTCAFPDEPGYEAHCYNDRQRKEQRSQAAFAETWLRNIVEQQNLQLPGSSARKPVE
jgi:hypothetical protein